MIEDHPRLCGEKFYYRLSSTSGAGSPPPMRGKARSKVTLLSLIQDHPRLCGEKELNFSVVLKGQGSPPPMRGKDLNSTYKLLAI